jgi:hypothetical protein
MQFKIGQNNAEISSSEIDLSLAFETDGKKLTALGHTYALLDITVQSFDPAHDIFYRAPAPLTPEELAEEVDIHVPKPLQQRMNGRMTPGTLDGLVVMQHIASARPSIPPLAALEKILRATGSVNSAILQADHGGILFVHNAGMEFHTGASAHSLKEFLDLSIEERERVFPDFHALEILLSGSDLDHFQNLDLGSLSTSRRIEISDFTPLCEFTSEAATLVETNPHLYTLIIGAAAIYVDILHEAQ